MLDGHQLKRSSAFDTLIQRQNSSILLLRLVNNTVYYRYILTTIRVTLLIHIFRHFEYHSRCGPLLYHLAYKN
jgi:hypothetical protein